jgi:hypothetical protein
LILEIFIERLITFKIYGWLLKNILKKEVEEGHRYFLRIFIVVGFLDPFFIDLFVLEGKFKEGVKIEKFFYLSEIIGNFLEIKASMLVLS